MVGERMGDSWGEALGRSRPYASHIPTTQQRTRVTVTAQKTALHALRVIKTIAAHGRGAKAFTAQHGERLVCVRHRIDPTGTRRLTTVELVVAERPIARKQSPLVSVSVAVHERAVQARLKISGARWDPVEQVWRVRRATAVALGLRARIVPSE